MSEIGNRHMHFNLDDPHQKTCFDFLKLLKKSSSPFVSDLVCAYLKMQNITDLAFLSSKEAKAIAEGVTYKFMSPEQYMSQTNNLALQTMMALVNSGFAQQPVNLQTIVPVPQNIPASDDSIAHSSPALDLESDVPKKLDSNYAADKNVPKYSSDIDDNESKPMFVDNVETPDNSNSMEESVYDDDSESLPDSQEEDDDDDDNDNYINPKLAGGLSLFFN